MSRMRVWLLLVCALALVAVPAHSAGRTWTVIGGGFTPDHAVWAQGFYPKTIEIAVGDAVTWKVEGFHTVSFLSGEKAPALEVQEGDKTYFNPAVFFPSGSSSYDGSGYRNSGVPPEFPKTMLYSLRFTKAGTYTYMCLVHGPGMSGTVVVKDSAMGSPEAVVRQARTQQAATIRAGGAAWRTARPQRSGKSVTIPLRGDTRVGYSLMRFTREPLVIDRGTTVTWRMADPFEIHTVTFLGGQKQPEFVVVEPQQGGPPKLLVNPKAAAPTPGKTYAGGFANSGIMFTKGFGPPMAPSSYSLTFTRPGRYEYVCVVHMPIEGMKGTIIVR